MENRIDKIKAKFQGEALKNNIRRYTMARLEIDIRSTAWCMKMKGYSDDEIRTAIKPKIDILSSLYNQEES